MIDKEVICDLLIYTVKNLNKCIINLKKNRTNSYILCCKYYRHVLKFTTYCIDPDVLTL